MTRRAAQRGDDVIHGWRRPGVEAPVPMIIECLLDEAVVAGLRAGDESEVRYALGLPQAMIRNVVAKALTVSQDTGKSTT